MPEARVGMGRRLAAVAYDSLILFALASLATFALVQMLGDPLGPAGRWLLRITILVIAFLFLGGFWTQGGQTVGMRAWKIRVVDADGGPIGWGAAGRRFAAALLSWMPAGLGFWWALFDKEGLAWHDRLSATRLVRTDQGRRGAQTARRKR